MNIDILKTDPIIGKMKMTETGNGVTLKTGMTWKSWGEDIIIVLKSETYTDFEYQIVYKNIEGYPAIQVVKDTSIKAIDEPTFVKIKGTEFTNGVI